MDRSDLETSLDFKLKAKNLLITFHPANLEDQTPTEQMKELLAAVAKLDDTGLIFTLPNADTGGRELATMLQNFVAQHANARVYPSLGQLRYLSCMTYCDGVIGNSSSGLLEAPTLRKGTINIGERQRGRLQATSIINCPADRIAITEALQKLFSVAFQATLPSAINPYGDGGASARICSIIKGLSFADLQTKPFYDLQHVNADSFRAKP
jgi:GDP/UDP-N,N'-diacetylbacillosamine 2-epimerase (hydrolysing)